MYRIVTLLPLVLASLMMTMHAASTEMAPQEVDINKQLIASILACDANSFKTKFNDYRSTTDAAHFSTAQAQLLELAQSFKTQKDHERSARLNDTTNRALAVISFWATLTVTGICGIVALATSKSVIYDPRDRNIFCFLTILIAGVSTACFSKHVLHDFHGIRHNHTQQLTKEIEALDEIIKYLTHSV